jgi:hypothetical protein
MLQSNLWFVVLNLHKRREFCSSKILKYSSNLKSFLKILWLNALGELWTVEFQSCKNWSNNVCFVLCFSTTCLTQYAVHRYQLSFVILINIGLSCYIEILNKLCHKLVFTLLKESIRNTKFKKKKKVFKKLYMINNDKSKMDNPMKLAT